MRPARRHGARSKRPQGTGRRGQGRVTRARAAPAPSAEAGGARGEVDARECARPSTLECVYWAKLHIDVLDWTRGRHTKLELGRTSAGGFAQTCANSSSVASERAPLAPMMSYSSGLCVARSAGGSQHGSPWTPSQWSPCACLVHMATKTKLDRASAARCCCCGSLSRDSRLHRCQPPKQFYPDLLCGSCHKGVPVLPGVRGLPPVCG